MIDHVLQTHKLNLMIAEMIVKDLSPDQMCQQPHGLINHPAWSLGHLVKSAHECFGFLGIEASLPAGWDETFKTGTPPNPDVGANPSKDALLGQLRAVHDHLTQALPAVKPATLATPHPVEEIRPYFPTVGDHVIYLMTAHEMDHLGQLAAWRRAMGLPPAM